MSADDSFKRDLLRSTSHMAGKACPVVGSAIRCWRTGVLPGRRQFRQGGGGTGTEGSTSWGKKVLILQAPGLEIHPLAADDPSPGWDAAAAFFTSGAATAR